MILTLCLSIVAIASVITLIALKEKRSVDLERKRSYKIINSITSRGVMKSRLTDLEEQERDDLLCLVDDQRRWLSIEECARLTELNNKKYNRHQI